MTRAEEYMKRASADVQRAVTAMQQDAAQMRSNLDRREVEIKKQIQDLKSKRTRYEADLARGDDGIMPNHRDARKINDIMNDIKDLEVTLDKERSEVLQQIQQYESDIKSLQSQAAEFRNKATQL